MARGISTKTLLEKKYKTFEFDGSFKELFGNPEKGGCWLIYGAEKNGKTQFALQLAKYLASFEKVRYISAEEGTGKNFQDSAARAGLNDKDTNIIFTDYEPLEELEKQLTNRKGPKIVLVDNITVYNDELKNGIMRKLLKKYENITFIFLAHEEKNEPYTATAKMCKKLAQIIIRVVGLTAFIGGRCPGGEYQVIEAKSNLYHGTQIKEKQHEHNS